MTKSTHFYIYVVDMGVVFVTYGLTAFMVELEVLDSNLQEV